MLEKRQHYLLLRYIGIFANSLLDAGTACGCLWSEKAESNGPQLIGEIVALWLLKILAGSDMCFVHIGAADYSINALR